jgi:hypothetical protein
MSDDTQEKQKAAKQVTQVGIRVLAQSMQPAAMTCTHSSSVHAQPVAS